LDPSQLDATVAGRIPVRTNRDDRYFTDEYQFMPLDGYSAMFERMLANPLIEVELATDYYAVQSKIAYHELIYTGPIDAFFDYCFGKLPYRSLEFQLQTLALSKYQGTGTVNWPNEHEYTRVTEFKHLTGQEHSFTTLCFEYPRAEGDPYYPVPRPENAEQYRKYERLAGQIPGVHFVGRLATYKYYNMDQVVAQALSLYERLKNRAGEARQASD
jgi:UDP-galactopyranose mutase